MSQSSSPARSHVIKRPKMSHNNIIVTVTDENPPSLLILDPDAGCDLKSQTQSLKHLSASAPAMRTDLVKSEKGDFFMPPSSSKSRQKKFHRHFKTVPQEETVLDYYSCALVGDILLQGFLYISENYFAFYSNVFGYVTKLLIPISTVVNITKERTAKIFPNAVGIQTQTERHVFASLISRDTTFKLMYKVWKHTQQASEGPLIISKGSGEGFDDMNGDMAIADDSSGDSGSGNDSALEASSCSPSPQSTPGIEKLLHAKNAANNNNNHVIAASISHLRSSASAQFDNSNEIGSLRQISHGPLPSSAYLRRGPSSSNATIVNNTDGEQSRSSSAVKNVDSQKGRKWFRGSSNTSFLLMTATALLVFLFISAAILLFRISNLQQKMTERSANMNSEQFYQDLLKWQNRLHSNSADEIHQFIDSNLQQIVKVRESLEALSTLFTNGQQGSLMGDHHHQPPSASHFSNTER